MLTEEAVLEALKQVYDPEIGIDIVNLGMIYNVDIQDEGKTVKIDMTLTTMGCPLFDQLQGQIVQLLKDMGVENVEVNLVWSPPWTPAMMSEEARMMLRYLF